MLVVDVVIEVGGGARGRREDRRHGLQQPVGGQRGDVACTRRSSTAAASRARAARSLASRIRPDLLPRGLDEGLLVAPHDLGAETGGDAVGDRAVELAEPAVLGRRQRACSSAGHSPYSGGGSSGVSRRPTTSASRSSTAAAAVASAWPLGPSGAALRTS